MLQPVKPQGPVEIQIDTIKAASVTGKIDRNTNFTQTGLTKIDGAAFNRAYATLSSPDVLKTLQTLPGVASGTELLSSLYVHGGDGSDNLFLLDGVPLYQICHLGGIFSSFNTDVIDNMDFYKSGFPALKGGELLLGDVYGGVGETGIDEARFLTGKASAAFLNGSKLKGGGLVDRRGQSTCRVLVFSGVNLFGGKSAFFKINHDSETPFLLCG